MTEERTSPLRERMIEDMRIHGIPVNPMTSKTTRNGAIVSSTLVL